MTVKFNSGISFLIPLPDAQQRKRLKLWTELAFVLAFVATGLCTLNSHQRGWIIALGLAWVFFTTDFSAANRKNLGLVWHNSLATFWALEFALLAAILIWAAGLAFGSALHIHYFKDNLILSKIGYLLGAPLQQAVIQLYCFTRLEKLLGCEHRACKWTAILFSLCHTPNPLLMLISWLGGRVSCRIFCRYRNLYTLAAAHGIIGASLAAFWPHWTVVAGAGFIKILLGH